MRILIITYSREVNPGTFLQAYGVQYALRQIYPDADIELLKHKRLYGISGAKKGTAQKKEKRDFIWLWGRISAIPRRLKYEYYYSTKFKFTKQEFGLFDYDPEQFKAFAESYDLIVVGSDTILVDLKKNDNYGLMWLLGVKTNKLLFAASASPANYSLSEDEATMLRQHFSTYKLLGVRDSVTYKLLREKIGMSDVVFRMFDPTYLIPSSEFNMPMLTKMKLDRIRKKQKVVVVNFGDGFKYKRTITEHLKSKGYYTVSTLYNPWADANLMTFSPFEWAAMYEYVDLTVTERFHDSVFTLRNNKPVVTIDWSPSRFASDGSSKCQNLLNSYGLDKLHCIYKSDEDLNKIFNITNSVDKIFSRELCIKTNEMIQEKYKKTMDFIGQQMKNIR